MWQHRADVSEGIMYHPCMTRPFMSSCQFGNLRSEKDGTRIRQWFGKTTAWVPSDAALSEIAGVSAWAEFIRRCRNGSGMAGLRMIEGGR